MSSPDASRTFTKIWDLVDVNFQNMEMPPLDDGPREPMPAGNPFDRIKASMYAFEYEGRTEFAKQEVVAPAASTDEVPEVGEVPATVPAWATNAQDCRVWHGMLTEYGVDESVTLTK